MKSYFRMMKSTAFASWRKCFVWTIFFSLLLDLSHLATWLGLTELLDINLVTFHSQFVHIIVDYFFWCLLSYRWQFCLNAHARACWSYTDTCSSIQLQIMVRRKAWRIAWSLAAEMSACLVVSQNCGPCSLYCFDVYCQLNNEISFHMLIE